MLPKVMKAYWDFGFKIDAGNPSRLYSVLVDAKSSRTLSNSGGFTVTDVFLFMALEKVFHPQSIFVIGNSFGLSTFVLAELFPHASIDAIDAEIEGLHASKGTELTRRIAEKYFPNVNVTVGFSPQDIGKATRSDAYDLIFVDGGHTNEQMQMDFEGMAAYLSEKCVVVFHDVASANMVSAWNKVLSKSQMMGFKGFPMGFTQLGTCVLARGSAGVIEYLRLIASEFQGPYQLGFSSADSIQYYKRPFFWDISIGHMEEIIRRKLRRMLNHLRAKTS